jgi:hypothetical protein
MSTNDDTATLQTEPLCAHSSALMCEAGTLHAANQASIFFYCVECGSFLGEDLLPISGDPMTEDLASPRSVAGPAPAKGTTLLPAQGQPAKLPGSPVQLAGLLNGLPKPLTGLAGLKLLPVSPPAPNQGGAGPAKAAKVPAKPKEVKIDHDSKYGRVLPGPWNGTPCPNTHKDCKGQMEAFYTLEFEEGNSYMYKCSNCSVITSISFRESKIAYND